MRCRAVQNFNVLVLSLKKSGILSGLELDEHVPLCVAEGAISRDYHLLYVNFLHVELLHDFIIRLSSPRNIQHQLPALQYIFEFIFIEALD